MPFTFLGPELEDLKLLILQKEIQLHCHQSSNYKSFSNLWHSNS